MLEIRIQGRGGQGAQVACRVLAGAFHRAGSWVQAFAAYGAERRGAPVSAALRVDENPITLRCDITTPDHLILLDPTLLSWASGDVGGVRPGGLILVNAPPPGPRRPEGDSHHVLAVNAAAIAAREGLGPLVATALLGAFAAATNVIALEDLLAAVREGSPSRSLENVSACAAGYRQTRPLATVR